MEVLAVVISLIITITLIKFVFSFHHLEKIDPHAVKSDRFCLIDIRDYISANNSPFPGADNIPLSYLSRELNKTVDCPKEILLISDDLRGARLAAKMIRKKRNKHVFYTKAG
ncbi:rhodanese-like domain-containing protein [Thalassobacillus sp. CUG 92003]|uniref:rhodanese-like domain-containing protein n=1 Tax=Thalassobacillus sp. CUG 92003 TaxID=2736641 RepID=UPI0015E7C68D|nr:rhodanese-like domain-containing protein [Thalassobacillus sp. CUG 92003]